MLLDFFRLETTNQHEEHEKQKVLKYTKDAKVANLLSFSREEHEKQEEYIFFRIETTNQHVVNFNSKCKLEIGECKMNIKSLNLNFNICNLQFAIMSFVYIRVYSWLKKPKIYNNFKIPTKHEGRESW